MTDKKMILQLGYYIIKLQTEMNALRGVFTEYRIDTPQGRREIPWREDAKRITQETAALEISSAQRYSLLQAIEPETQCSALIRGLYLHFLEDSDG